MLLVISPSLDSLEVWAETLEQETILGVIPGNPEPMFVTRFADPVLLTDPSRIVQLEPGLRDAVFSLYSSYPRRISYQGVSVAWSPERYPRVWCPSIDTVFFARTLARFLPAVNWFAEIGCGSGFLTKFALSQAPIARAVASDISLDALRCTADTLAELPQLSPVSLIRPVANDPEIGLSGQFDLLICNPPYIPRPDEQQDNPYEGLGLVAKLARDGQALLSENGRLLLNLSSLAGDQPLTWFANAGWAITAHERLIVPVKVNPVTNGISPSSKAWLDHLQSRGTIIEDSEHTSGYRWWHELRMYELQRKV